MKLSKGTIDIMKYFAEISEGIHIMPGNKIVSSIGEKTSVYALAEIVEIIPNEIVVTSLNKMMNIMTCEEDMDYQFGEKNVIATSSDGKYVMKYTYSPKELVPEPKMFRLNEDAVKFEFILDKNMNKTINKMINIIGPENVKFTNSDGQLVAVLDQNKSGDGNSGRFILVEDFESADGKKYNINIRKEHFKKLPDMFDYRVKCIHQGNTIVMLFNAIEPTGLVSFLEVLATEATSTVE